MREQYARDDLARLDAGPSRNLIDKRKLSMATILSIKL
jgi:hypothetical protein